MAGKCIEGVEIPDKAPCPVCGAYEFQPCGQRKKRDERARASKIADRAMQNLTRSVLSSRPQEKS